MTDERGPYPDLIEWQEWVNGRASHYLDLGLVMCFGDAKLVDGRFKGDCNKAEAMFNWCADNVATGWTMGNYHDEKHHAYQFMMHFEDEGDFVRAKLFVDTL